KRIHLIIWALYEDRLRFHIFYYSLFAGVSNVILVLNSSNEASFQYMELWFNRFPELNMPNNFPIFVVDIARSNLNGSKLCTSKNQIPEEFSSQVPSAAVYTNIYFCRFTNHAIFDKEIWTFARQLCSYRGCIRIPRPPPTWVLPNPVENTVYKRQPIYSVDELIKAVKLFLPKTENYIQNGEFVFKNQYGTFYVDLPSGAVNLRPVRCEICKQKCEQNHRRYVCIVQSGRSWSNIGAFQHSALLLTTAKIYAIVTNTFAPSVVQKIQSVSWCPNYPPDTYRRKVKKLTLKNKIINKFRAISNSLTR
ncbi:MAG: hypothetical protein ACFFBD_11555, partial [Candidatus Hodarchaeota archaeon]